MAMAPRPSGGGHVRSKSTGVPERKPPGSPSMRKSGPKSPAGPVIADIKIVGRNLQKSTDVATTKLREVWHNISELGVDKKKYPQSVVRELEASLDALVVQMENNQKDILKAVRMAKDAAGAMATVPDAETNETKTVDLDKNTHGTPLTAEQRMHEQRKAAAGLAPSPMAPTISPPVAPTTSPMVPQTAAAAGTSPMPGASPKAVRASALVRPGSASPKPAGSPRTARTSSRLASATTSSGSARDEGEAAVKQNTEKDDDDDDDEDNEDDDEDDEEAERKMEERMAQLRIAAAARKSKGQSPDGGERPKSGQPGASTVTSPTSGKTEQPRPSSAGSRKNDAKSAESHNVLRVTSETGVGAVVATEEQRDSSDTHILGADGYLRPARKSSFADVVDEATDEMRKKKAAKKKKALLTEKFLKDCESLDEATIKAQAAARAAELQKNPWGAVKKAIRRGSFDGLEPEHEDED